MCAQCPLGISLLVAGCVVGAVAMHSGVLWINSYIVVCCNVLAEQQEMHGHSGMWKWLCGMFQPPMLIFHIHTFASMYVGTSKHEYCTHDACMVLFCALVFLNCVQIGAANQFRTLHQRTARIALVVVCGYFDFFGGGVFMYCS